MKTTPIQPLDPWDAYPNIDLYMDQVLSVIDKQLSVYYQDPTDRVMTASMVNNYVKQRLLPPPDKKKYRREQVTRLVMIGILKQVLSIAQIGKLLDLLFEENDGDDERLYNQFRDSLHQHFEHLRIMNENKTINSTTFDDVGHILDFALISFLARFEAASQLDRLALESEEHP